MAKPTVSQTKQMVEELLNLQSSFERYRELEKQVKANLVALKYHEISIPGRGRVFISESHRVAIPVGLAEFELGDAMAAKIIQVKKSVSNKLFEAFVEAGEISQAKRDRILAQAERTPVVSLYVRPLK
ncbi:MAG TPA: hypothetical protein VGD99_21745 [Anaerolineae bacterium]|jgi:hypothetical protein